MRMSYVKNQVYVVVEMDGSRMKCRWISVAGPVELPRRPRIRLLVNNLEVPMAGMKGYIKRQLDQQEGMAPRKKESVCGGQKIKEGLKEGGITDSSICRIRINAEFQREKGLCFGSKEM
jgi:hypothetical protein